MSQSIQFSRFALDSITDGGEVLYGIIVCEKGETKGHGILIDDAFLDSLVKLGKTGPIKLRANHPYDHGNVLTIIGEGKNFRRDLTADGTECVRCDGHMLDVTDDVTQKIIKLAHRAPHLFGMSVDVSFQATGVVKGGLKTAVATALNAVDFVDSPAATSSLFSIPVDSNATDKKDLQMAKSKEDIEKEEKEKMEAAAVAEKTALLEKLSKFEVLFEWCNKKMAEEKAKDAETDDEKKKKKMEADAAETLKLEAKKERDAELLKLSALAVKDVLALCGIAPKPSNPDAANQTAEPSLTSEELKLATKLGMTDPKDLKQFAANLASLPKENRLTLVK